VIGISTFIANMFILGIAAALWVLALAGFVLVVVRIADRIKGIR
tara:strand:+ start:171 stop:302 length:132 start_codon:yes stop_codon:yes gene_type:complete